MKGDLGRHRIGAVARLTGISEHVLRVWERRYGMVVPSRPHGGQRLYSDDDVARLRRLKHLTDLGHSIGTVARLPDKEIDALLRRHPETRAPPRDVSDLASPGSVAGAIRARFLEAITELDVSAADRVIARALVTFEPIELLEHVVVPLLKEVGHRWKESTFSIAQEHAASAVIRNQLGGFIRQLPTDAASPLAVCATPAGEQHEFGALFAAVIAVTRGWRSIYLGPSLPADDIAQAARQTKARVVLLSVVSLPQVELAREVTRLRTLLPRTTHIHLGGSGVDPKTTFIGVHYVRDLTALAKTLETTKR
jgi:MerR family transcriptional regulator, light-induced transcriptional regulator